MTHFKVKVVLLDLQRIMYVFLKTFYPCHCELGALHCCLTWKLVRLPLYVKAH